MTSNHEYNKYKEIINYLSKGRFSLFLNTSPTSLLGDCISLSAHILRYEIFPNTKPIATAKEIFGNAPKRVPVVKYPKDKNNYPDN